jgi:hypothetical protein
MANSIVSAWKGVMLGDAAITGFTVPNLESDTITLAGIDTADDTVVPATDQDLADIAGAAIVTSAALASKTVVTSGANSTFAAANLTFTAVTGDQYENYVLYQNTGTAGTSLLLVHFDTFTSGMPVTPNGGDIVNAFHASGIFQF